MSDMKRELKRLQVKILPQFTFAMDHLMLQWSTNSWEADQFCGMSAIGKAFNMLEAHKKLTNLR